MNPKDYVKNVLVTEARDFAPLQERFQQIRAIRLLHGAIGMASELAEIRSMAQKTHIDVTNLKEEMGDVYWYMGIMIDELKVDPSTVMGSDPEYAGRNKDEDAKKDNLNFYIDSMTINIGEAIDLLKKNLMYGKALNEEGLIAQLKAVDLSISSALQTYGLLPSASRERNIEKLRARYGEKFTEAAALERNLTVEREILEKN